MSDSSIDEETMVTPTDATARRRGAVTTARGVESPVGDRDRRANGRGGAASVGAGGGGGGGAAAASAPTSAARREAGRAKRAPPRVDVTIEGFVVSIEQVVDLHTGELVHSAQNGGTMRRFGAGAGAATPSNRHTARKHLEAYEAELRRQAAAPKKRGRPSRKSVDEQRAQERSACRDAYMYRSYEACLALLAQPVSRFLHTALGGERASRRQRDGKSVAWRRLAALVDGSHATRSDDDDDDDGGGGGGGDESAEGALRPFSSLATRAGSRYKIVLGLAQRIAKSATLVQTDRVSVVRYADELPEIGDYLVLGCAVEANAKGRRVYRVCESRLRHSEVADLDVALLRCVCDYEMESRALSQMLVDAVAAALERAGLPRQATFRLCDPRLELGKAPSFDELFVRSRYLQRRFVAEIEQHFSEATRGALHALDAADTLRLLRTVWHKPVQLCFEWTFSALLGGDDDGDGDMSAMVLDAAEYVRLLRSTHREPDRRDVDAVQFYQTRVRTLLRAPGAPCTGISHAELVQSESDARHASRLVAMGALGCYDDRAAAAGAAAADGDTVVVAERLYWTSGEFSRRSLLRRGLSRINASRNGRAARNDSGGGGGGEEDDHDNVDDDEQEAAACREHQAAVFESVRRGNGVFIVDGARGSGKTWLATHCRDASARRRRRPCLALQAEGGDTGGGGGAPLFNAARVLRELRRGRASVRAVDAMVGAHFRASRIGTGVGGGGGAARVQRRANLSPAEQVRALGNGARHRTVGDAVLRYFRGKKSGGAAERDAKSHLAALLDLAFYCKVTRAQLRDFFLSCALLGTEMLIVDNAERLPDDVLGALLDTMRGVRALVLLGCREACAPTNAVRIFTQLAFVVGTMPTQFGRYVQWPSDLAVGSAVRQREPLAHSVDAAVANNDAEEAAAAAADAEDALDGAQRAAMRRVAEALCSAGGSSAYLPARYARSAQELYGRDDGDDDGASSAAAAAAPPLALAVIVERDTGDDSTLACAHKHGASAARDALVEHLLQLHTGDGRSDVQGASGVRFVVASNYARRHLNALCHEWRMRRATEYREQRTAGVRLAAPLPSEVFATADELERTEFERAEAWQRCADAWVAAAVKGDEGADTAAAAAALLPLHRGDTVLFERSHAGGRVGDCPLPSDAVRAGSGGTIEFIVEFVPVVGGGGGGARDCAHESPPRIDGLVFHESTAQAANVERTFIALHGDATLVCLGVYARADISHGYALTLRQAEQVPQESRALSVVVTSRAPGDALTHGALSSVAAATTHRLVFVDDGETLDGLVRRATSTSPPQSMDIVLCECTRAVGHVRDALKK